MSLNEEAGVSPPFTVRRIGLEASRSIEEKTRSGFVAKYLSGDFILDIGYRGYAKDVEPVVAQAIGVELDYPGYDGRTLPFGDETQDAVFASHCLEHIDDYRTALREWHRVLKIGGFMIIAVPHQFLYERRTRMPSKWNADHKRFYTPASLMTEIEASLAPNTYRLRHLVDNDMYYDYSVTPEFHAGGCYEVELVIERISPPLWVFEEPEPTEDAGPPELVSKLEALSQEINALEQPELDSFPAKVTAATQEVDIDLHRDGPQAPEISSPAEPTADDSSAVGKPKQSAFRGLLSRYRDLRSFPEHVLAAIGELSVRVSRHGEEQERRAREQAIALEAARNEVTRTRQDLNRVAAELQARQASTMSQLAASVSGNILDKLGKGLVAASEHNADQHAATLSQIREVATIVRTGIQESVERTNQQTSRIDNLSLTISEGAKLYPSWEWTTETASRVLANLRLLKPVGIVGVGKIRVGREYDGGYVMIDHFGSVGAALSLGIADDVSWDLDIAGRDIPVWQFDPSVEASPEAHEGFNFSKIRVAAEDGDEGVSLHTIISTRIYPDARPLLLKMDIEGDEWEVLRATDEEVLARFDQIVCEFHGLHQLADEGFAAKAHEVLTKLAHTHVVHHVHGNNCGSFVNVGNVVVPQTLEVSFARRAAYQTTECAELFPTELDRPNEPGRADLYLGSFRF